MPKQESHLSEEAKKVIVEKLHAAATIGAPVVGAVEPAQAQFAIVERKLAVEIRRNNEMTAASKNVEEPKKRRGPNHP